MNRNYIGNKSGLFFYYFSLTCAFYCYIFFKHIFSY